MPVRFTLRRINKFDARYNPETIKQLIEQQYESLIDEPVAWQIRKIRNKFSGETLKTEADIALFKWTR